MSDPPESIRAFVAVPVPAALREAIARQIRTWRANVSAPSVRWIEAEKLHLTLRFIGKVRFTQLNELIQSVEHAVRNVSTLCLTTEALGVFPHTRNPRVLWLGISGDVAALRQLQQRIESATAHFGAPPEAREFHAHLTMARVKNATAADRHLIASAHTQWKVEPFGSWLVDRVELMRSDLSPQGSFYTVLRSIPFSTQ